MKRNRRTHSSCLFSGIWREARNSNHANNLQYKWSLVQLLFYRDAYWQPFTGLHLSRAAWMNCSVGPLSFPLVPPPLFFFFPPFRRYRCAGHNAQIPFHKSQLCSQVHISKKNQKKNPAPHAVKRTEPAVRSNAGKTSSCNTLGITAAHLSC